MTTCRLTIVDDDAAIRVGLRGIAEASGAEVLGEADNGCSAIEQAELLQPELILLDVTMPVMNGFAAAAELQKRMPKLQIVFVSQHRDRIYVEEALRKGASGYVVKQAAGTELPAAIAAVSSGRIFISPLIKMRPAGDVG